MAAKYRKIDPRIWEDEKFVDLTTEQKLITIHAFSGRQTNRCGLYTFSVALGAEQTRIDSDSYAKGFPYVCDTLRWKYDKQVRVLYIPTWWKYNPPENPKHLQGCLEDLHDLPLTPLFSEFATNVEHVPPHSREVFRIAMEIAMAKQEQKQKQELERKQKRSAGADASGGADATGPLVAKKERKPASGPYHELIRTFLAAWKERYQCDYVGFSYDGKDGRHVKWILHAVLQDVAEATEIVKAYLADEDQWLIDKRHPIGLLVSNFNKYRIREQLFAKPKGPNGNGTIKPAGAFTGARRSLPDVVAPRTAEG